MKFIKDCENCSKKMIIDFGSLNVSGKIKMTCSDCKKILEVLIR